MSPVTRILILILAIAGGMMYKRLNEMLGDVKAPTLPLNQWWGDEPEPTDWQAYLANSSEVIGNKLLYADQVNNFNIIFLIINNYISLFFNYFPQ